MGVKVEPSSVAKESCPRSTPRFGERWPLQQTYPVASPLLRIGAIPQRLDGDEDANAISNLLDAEFFQHGLVTFQQVAAVEIIGCRPILSHQHRHQHRLNIQSAIMVDLRPGPPNHSNSPRKISSYWGQLIERSHSPTCFSSQDLKMASRQQCVIFSCSFRSSKLRDRWEQIKQHSLYRARRIVDVRELRLGRTGEVAMTKFGRRSSSMAGRGG